MLRLQALPLEMFYGSGAVGDAARFCQAPIRCQSVQMARTANEEIHAPPRDAPRPDYPLSEFIARYPDDAACLERLWRERHAPDGHHAHCPRCARTRKFHRTR